MRVTADEWAEAAQKPQLALEARRPARKRPGPANRVGDWAIGRVGVRGMSPGCSSWASVPHSTCGFVSGTWLLAQRNGVEVKDPRTVPRPVDRADVGRC